MDFIKRVAEYDSLPGQHRLKAFRKLLRETEFKLLTTAGNPHEYEFKVRRGGDELKEQVRELATHRALSIPDVLRLSDFEIVVDTRIRLQTK